MYKNYIFDLYGTLADIHTDEEQPELWEKLSMFYSSYGAGYSSKEIKTEYLQLCREEEEKLTEKEYPEIEITRVFQRLFLLRGVDSDIELARQAGTLFRKLSLEYIRLYDGVEELIARLRQEGKMIYLLSNAQRLFTEPELRQLQIYDSFDGVVLSSDEGCKKPSKNFFQKLLNRYPIDPEASIMIGNDAVADILGAKQMGMDTLYIHSNISPELTEKVDCTYAVLDGDVHKISKLILVTNSYEGWSSLEY